MTGTMSWGIARVGPAHTGKVMSWQGIAMYGALGIGAPLGLAIQASFGFVGVAVLTIAAPLTAALLAMRVPAVPAGGGGRVPFYRVVGLIWQPGLILTLATIPFATMATFLALDFAAHGWNGAGLALAGFAAGYIAVRLVGSHWPDRFGGTTVAAMSLAIETAGQAILWIAARPDVASAGAVLTGIGFSLVFPSMGVEATRRVKPELRGRAVGNFIAFFDVALGLTGPLLGLVVTYGGYSAAFMIGTVSAAAALLVLFALNRNGGTS
jgi:predicted MFS family arabinose efflux permease